MNIQAIRDNLQAFEKALDALETNAVEGNEGRAQELEAILYPLFAAYLPAKAAFDLTADAQHPQRPAPLPKVATLEQVAVHEAAERAYKQADYQHKEAFKAAAAVLKPLSDKLTSVMPKFAWIYYPEGDCYFGWDSGEWGGYHRSLHVRKSLNDLFTLEHTSYYP